MADTHATGLAEPEVGSYFVANYPPFSVWTQEAVVTRCSARPSRRRQPRACRLACTCISRSAGSAAISVTSGSTRTRTRSRSSSTWTGWSASGSSRRPRRALAGRPLDFVYFGGGTPSFLSTKQLEGLVGRLTAIRPWASASEITFECEPGTLSGQKLKVIRAAGVTRLSLGRRELRRCACSN